MLFQRVAKSWSRRQPERRLASRPASSPPTLLGSCSSAVDGSGRRPFKDDLGLVADRAPDADALDVLTGFGAAEIIAPPFEHRLAAARPTKQEDPLLARNVDLHFVHRDGVSLANRFDTAAHASPPTYWGPIIRGSGYARLERRRGERRSLAASPPAPIVLRLSRWPASARGRVAVL